MKGLPRSLKSTKGSALVKKSALRKLPITIADGAPGFGSILLGGIPEGNVYFKCCVFDVTFSSVDADLIATFDGDFSLGTAATVDNVLAGNDINIMASTPMGAATGKVSPRIHAVSTAGVIINNTDRSQSLYLNVLIDDAAISGPVDLIVDGMLYFDFAVVGDD